MLKTIVNYIICIMLFGVIAACGGGSDNQGTVTEPSNNQQEPNQTETPNTENFLPDDIVNRSIGLTITAGDIAKIKALMPEFEQSLMLYMQYGEMVYFHSDNYTGWKYQGSFSYRNGSDNQLSLTLDMVNDALDFSADLLFTTANSGTWQATIANESYRGNFTFGGYLGPNSYTFKGDLTLDNSFVSTITGVDYPYHVYLPEGYAESTEDYPLLITTDAQNGFTAYSHSVEFAKKNIIMVGVAEGYDGRREIDFLPPGVDDYLRFIRTELVPFLKANYRVDDTSLAIQGFSFGGVMARNMIIEEMENMNNNQARLFHHFIIADGSFWYNDGVYTQTENTIFATNNAFNSIIYLGAANAGNGIVVNAWYREMLERNITGLTLGYDDYNLSHGQSRVPALRAGIEVIYPD